MSIFQKIKNIFRSVVKTADDALTNYSRDIEFAIVDSKKKASEFQKVISETNAQIIGFKNEADKKDKKVTELTNAAARAAKSGDDEAARQLLIQKNEVKAEYNTLMQQVVAGENTVENARKQLKMLNDKIAHAESSKLSLEVREKSADIRNSLAASQSNLNTGDDPLAALDDYEKAVSQKENMATAIEQEVGLESQNVQADLLNKYGGNSATSVEDELAALKANM